MQVFVCIKNPPTHIYCEFVINNCISLSPMFIVYL